MGFIKNLRSQAKRFPFKTSAVYLLNEVFIRGINLAYIPILAIYLAPAEYGILGNLTSCLSFFIFSLGLNINNYAPVFFSKTDNKKSSSAFFASLLLVLLCFTGLLLIIELCNFQFVLLIFKSRTNALLITAAAFFEILVSYKINCSIIRNEPKVVLRLTIFKNIIDFACTLFLLVVLHLSFLSRIGGLLISGICSLYFFKDELLRLRFVPFPTQKEIFCFLKGSVGLLPHELSLWFRGGMDRILILNVISASVAGIYSLSFQLALIMAIIAVAVNNALIPRIYKAENDHRFSQLYFNYFKVYAAIIAAVFAIMFIVFPLVVQAFIPPKYDGFIFYYRILLVGFLFKAFYFYFVNTVLFRGRSADLSRISVTVSAIHFVLLLTLVKHTGITGAAVIFCFSELLLLVIVTIRGLGVIKKMQITDVALSY